jgi:hypothetical protein
MAEGGEKVRQGDRLSLTDALELLRVLNTTEQVMPTDEQVYKGAAEGLSSCHLSHRWR